MRGRFWRAPGLRQARTMPVVSAPHVRTTDAPSRRSAGPLHQSGGPFTARRLRPRRAGPSRSRSTAPAGCSDGGARCRITTNRPTPIARTRTANQSAHRTARPARASASSGHHAASSGVSSLMTRRYIGNRSIVNRTSPLIRPVGEYWRGFRVSSVSSGHQAPTFDFGHGNAPAQLARFGNLPHVEQRCGQVEWFSCTPRSRRHPFLVSIDSLLE